MMSQDHDWASMHARYLALRSIRVQVRPRDCSKVSLRAEADVEARCEAAAPGLTSHALIEMTSAEAAAEIRRSAGNMGGFCRTESIGFCRAESEVSDLTCRTSCSDMEVNMFCRTESVVFERNSDLGWSAASPAPPPLQFRPSLSPAGGLNDAEHPRSLECSAETRSQGKGDISAVELEPTQSCMPMGLRHQDAPAGALEEGTPTAEREAHAAARLWSVCRVFTVAARRDGGRFDCCAANAATAILRISSGSVLFTRCSMLCS